MSKKLDGKVAVVTGASKGIGAAIAGHLAEAGTAVVVNYASSKAGADKGSLRSRKKGAGPLPFRRTSRSPPTSNGYSQNR